MICSVHVSLLPYEIKIGFVYVWEHMLLNWLGGCDEVELKVRDGCSDNLGIVRLLCVNNP